MYICWYLCVSTTLYLYSLLNSVILSPCSIKCITVATTVVTVATITDSSIAKIFTLYNVCYCGYHKVTSENQNSSLLLPPQVSSNIQ